MFKNGQNNVHIISSFLLRYSYSSLTKYYVKMKNYTLEYSKFETILYGATEENGMTVGGEEIDTELVSIQHT